MAKPKEMRLIPAKARLRDELPTHTKWLEAVAWADLGAHGLRVATFELLRRRVGPARTRAAKSGRFDFTPG